MPPEELTKYSVYLEERKLLIDASRESARTFDKAILTFGSAIFGFSIAFVKDIAPKPTQGSLGWLVASWMLFSVGLLVILLSFLFSHKACHYEIEIGAHFLLDEDQESKKERRKAKKNGWSVATDWCNFLCPPILFLGLICWSYFAYDNLRQGDTPLSKTETSTEKGYVPPSSPAKAPPQPQAPAQPTRPGANEPPQETRK